MPAIRGRICEHLEFLGFAYSPATSETPRSFPSRESGQRSRDDDQRELMIARHTGHLMRHQKGIIHEIH